MSPGASWEPFEISEAEYRELLPHVLGPDRGELRQHARYSWQEFSLDPSFDAYLDYSAWLQAVCKKHRPSYRAKLQNLGERQH